MWTVLYGVLATFGATKVAPVNPKTALAEFTSHTAFGLTAAALAVGLGDERLFTGKIPLSASTAASGTGGATPASGPRTGGRLAGPRRGRGKRLTVVG